MRWDIFCAVVDNLGDIGVCWRLSRQLVAEQGAAVRLWVDDLVAFRSIVSQADATLEAQVHEGVEVRLWPRRFPGVDPADVVVETFGCDLPATYIEAMKARSRAPVWINLEYLSAESWVGRCHALPSPQPPLTKYFFFPGFAQDTGGLLMERDLTARREAFQSDGAGQAAFLARLGVPPRTSDEVLVSLFCYPQAPAQALFDAWANLGRPVRVVAFAETAGAGALVAAGLANASRGPVSGSIVPFLSQDDYVRMLWACDWNFVRGEDSFVRAHWAGRPFVWQAYPQAEEAHRLKVQSFLARYLGASAMGASSGLPDLWAAWNRFLPAARLMPAWQASRATDTGLREIARLWRSKMETLGDLAANLARFCRERV